MQNVHEVYWDHPEYHSDPFFKYGVPLARYFSEIVYNVAYKFASSSILLEALRFVAREFVYRFHNSRDCIHYLIHCADEIRTEIIEENTE